MVQRYDPSVYMQKADDGDYVTYEDYEKLINSHEKLVKALRKLRDEYDDNNHNKHHKEFHRMCKICVIDKAFKEAAIGE